MALNVDAQRAFRYPEDLRRLVTAVRDCHEYDENQWVEWKSAITGADGIAEPLLTVGAKEVISVNVLGFANRSPAVAANWAEGHAYLLIGVEPGRVSGVRPSDREKVFAAINSYVPGDVEWRPEYVDVDGVTVLVVIIDPPAQGHPIHTLQKDINNRRAGDVYIRHPGKTEQARPADMQMLTRRAQPARRAIDVTLLAAAPIEATVDPVPHFGRWAAEQRRELIPTPTNSIIPGLSSVDLARLFVLSNPLTIPDSRSLDDYAKEVDDYLARAQRVLVQRAHRRQIHHGGAQLRLELHNPTDGNLADLDLTLHIRGARAYPDQILHEARVHYDSVLPEPPRPHGSTHPLPTIYGRSGFFADQWLPPMPRHRRAAVADPGQSWTTCQLDDGYTIHYDSIDMRPQSGRMLASIPLAVPSDATVLTLKWDATASNIDGRIGGELAVDVIASTFDPDTAHLETSAGD